MKPHEPNPRIIDGFSRRINYLRLSITDRCNLRCHYCMPPGDVRKLERSEVLSFEERPWSGPYAVTVEDYHAMATRKTCALFVELCRRIGVLKGDCVAIDGSKFKTVNNRDKNFTKGKIASRIAHLEAGIARYSRRWCGPTARKRARHGLGRSPT